MRLQRSDCHEYHDGLRNGRRTGRSQRNLDMSAEGETEITSSLISFSTVEAHGLFGRLPSSHCGRVVEDPVLANISVALGWADQCFSRGYETIDPSLTRMHRLPAEARNYTNQFTPRISQQLTRAGVHGHWPSHILETKWCSSHERTRGSSAT